MAERMHKATWYSTMVLNIQLSLESLEDLRTYVNVECINIKHINTEKFKNNKPIKC